MVTSREICHFVAGHHKVHGTYWRVCILSYLCCKAEYGHGATHGDQKQNFIITWVVTMRSIAPILKRTYPGSGIVLLVTN